MHSNDFVIQLIISLSRGKESVSKRDEQIKDVHSSQSKREDIMFRLEKISLMIDDELE